MHLQTDRALIPANAPAVRYLHVAISAPAKPATAGAGAARTPVDVALVLDRSGSMGGSKFDMARTAVEHAVRLLKPEDHLGVACYDEEIITVLDRTPATKEAKTLVLQRLAGVDARGSTDLCGGWLRGADLAAGGSAAAEATALHAEEGRIAKVLLLTDGLANHGVIDHAELVANARRLRGEGILTSTFGVGADFDEELLSTLATEGGGHFYFIEQARQIPDFFASELGETLEVVARDAVFEVSCDPGVEAMVLNGFPMQHVDGRLRVQLGNLVADQEVTLIVAVAFKGTLSEGVSLGVQCRVSDADGALFPEPVAVNWRAVGTAEDEQQPVNREVRLAVATLLADRARAQALAANRRGDFEVARRIIRQMLDDLRAMAPGDREVLALIDQLHHDELTFADAMSPIAMKQRHFAAYAASHSRDAGGTARRTKPRQ